MGAPGLLKIPENPLDLLPLALLLPFGWVAQSLEVGGGVAPPDDDDDGVGAGVGAGVGDKVGENV